MNRLGFIGGSDARRIMEGDWHTWLEKTGQQQPADLSDNLAVQLGVHAPVISTSAGSRNTIMQTIILCMSNIASLRMLAKCFVAGLSMVTSTNSMPFLSASIPMIATIWNHASGNTCRRCSFI